MSYTVTRRVLIQKGPNGLGFSVKGGGDVGIPLVVSRVEAGGGAVGLLKVGMEVSAVNGISLEGLPHYAAVEVLRRTRSPVILFVRNPPSKPDSHIESYRTRGTLRQSEGYETPNYSRSILRDDTHNITSNNITSNNITSNNITSNNITSNNCNSVTSPDDKYDTEYKLYYGNETPDMAERMAAADYGPSNADLYDLRTVKRYVKEILHLPKEIFAKKLAWKFPPVALGKFHKWLLTKLAKFDCDAPQNSANYIFDAFSQSLYLARSIYDLVHLIRTLIAMKRTNTPSSTALQTVHSTTLPTLSTTAEFNNPQVMASFLTELAEIRSQLAKAKEREVVPLSPASQRERPDTVQTQISKQDAEIRALREQLGVYEARIAALSTSTNTPHKDADIGTFFKEGFKRIKMRTLRRKHSLPMSVHDKVSCTVRPVKSEYKPCDEELVVINGTDPCTSTPKQGPVKRTVFSPVSLDSDNHNEIVIQVGGEEVRAHTLQAAYSDEIKSEGGPGLQGGTGLQADPARERLYSSDDDYVQMHATLSPDGTLTRVPLQPTEEQVIQRLSADHKRSSVDSSQSKSSVESVKLKHKQRILIERRSVADDCMTDDYIHMGGGVADSDTETDYVSCDTAAQPGGEQEQEQGEQEQQYTVDKSDTMSTSTVKADVNVLEERQINATQVREMNKDVDSILGDVKLLYMMEEALKKPPTLPPNTPYIFNVSSTGSLHNNMTSPGQGARPAGGMVKAHEVPIYAKVERVCSPPPARIRPFSLGETSNCSYTSQEELMRHEVCSKQTVPSSPHIRKTSLTSNGSSVELKSDYSSDRPSSYNTSHTLSTEPSHGDRLSSSDCVVQEEYLDRRLSVLSDGKPTYDNVFSPNTPAIAEDPLTPTTRSANVSFYQPDCLNTEVGEDFFKHRDGRGREKKKTPFKKMLSFGKGKNRKKGPAGQDENGVDSDRSRRTSSGEGVSATSPRSTSGSLRSPNRSSASFSQDTSLRSRGSSGNSQDMAPAARSRGSSGTSSLSQDNVRVSTGTGTGTTSVRSSTGSYSQSSELASTRHSPIIESNGPATQPVEIAGGLPDIDTPENESSERLSVTTKPRGFYGDLDINFDEMPVKNEPILDIRNETIIDLDGDIIKDPDELKILRENSSFSYSSVENNTFLLTDNIDKPLIADANLTAKVENELQIEKECSKMVSEITRLASPDTFLRVRGSEMRHNTPSPSFSEIDMLLGDISKDLDNFTIN